MKPWDSLNRRKPDPVARICTINARKFDGSIHRSWKADLIEETDEVFVLVGTFEHEVNHPDLGHIPIGTISHEIYWKRKSFNVFRFHEPNGDFMFFYCNVNLPPILNGDSLDYIDLDIDLLVKSGEDVRILDEEDFERNSIEMRYGDDVTSIAREAVKELKQMIRNRAYPFENLPA
jgi:uncharacterized protein